MTSSIGFAAKFKVALGISRTKELFVPRFKSVTSLIDKAQGFSKQDTLLSGRIRDLGEKNNLLNSDSIRNSIRKGLIYLKDQGWFSDKEYEEIRNIIP